MPPVFYMVLIAVNLGFGCVSVRNLIASDNIVLLLASVLCLVAQFWIIIWAALALASKLH